MIRKLLEKFTGFRESPTTATPEALSRRGFLLGACAAVGTVYVSSRIGVDAVSAAAMPPLSPQEADDVGMELAQYWDNQPRRRDDDPRRRRDDDRGRRYDDRGRRHDNRRPKRTSRRDLERQCRQSKRFRSDNRQLCRQVTGRNFGRSGSCIQFGPLQICE